MLKDSELRPWRVFVSALSDLDLLRLSSFGVCNASCEWYLDETKILALPDTGTASFAAEYGVKSTLFEGCVLRTIRLEVSVQECCWTRGHRDPNVWKCQIVFPICCESHPNCQWKLWICIHSICLAHPCYPQGVSLGQACAAIVPPAQWSIITVRHFNPFIALFWANHPSTYVPWLQVAFFFPDVSPHGLRLGMHMRIYLQSR